MAKRFHEIRNVRRLSVAVLLAGLLGGGWLYAGAASDLDLKQARSQLQRLFGADLKRDQVQIKNIKPGPGGGNVIVEAQVETAFHFTREGRDWRIAEIRLGDRQWESIELVEEAVRREKTRRTGQELLRVATGLDNYRRAHGGFVEAQEIGGLLDELVPRYLSPLVRFDLWGTPLNYQGAAAHYRLSSAGPDRRAGTPDDVVLEDGVLKPQTE